MKPTSSGSLLWQTVRSVLKGAVPLLACMGVMAVCAVLLELWPPLLLRRIVDDQLKQFNPVGLWQLAWLYLLATVAARVLAFSQSYLTAVVGQRILLRLRLLVAEHLEKLPVAYFDRTPVGDIMSRSTNDVEAVNSLFTTGVVGAITDLFRILGALIAMFVISPVLAVVAMVSMPVVFIAAEYFRRNIRLGQRGVRKAVADINSHLQETWSGARVIHVYGRSGRFLGRLLDHQRNYHRAADKAAVYFAFFPGVLEILRVMTIGAVLWVGARPALMVSQGLTVGDLAAFALLVGRLFAPIQELSQEYQVIQQALAGVERIAEVLKEEPEDRTANAAPAASTVDGRDVAGPASGHWQTCSGSDRTSSGRLFVTDLEFGYRPGVPVLKGVSLTIEPGERVAIVGRTGAGKTSLLHLIAGIYRPWRGLLEIDGLAPISLSPAQRRRLLGVVPQNVQMFPGTVRYNITLGDETLSLGELEQVLEAVGAAGWVSRLPEGIDTVLGPGGTDVSYGESQMLCLARALVYDPPLLLLDEPTSGVDAATETLLYQALRGLGGHKTLVLVSHRLSGLDDVDRVIILANGRVVQDGRPEVLAARGGWYHVFKELETLGWKVGGNS
ncbi:MAG: ABC transporter ATP-binding protein [Bacillota bacterium]